MSNIRARLSPDTSQQQRYESIQFHDFENNNVEEPNASDQKFAIKLERRKTLTALNRIAVIAGFLFAMAGIIIMMFETELTIYNWPRGIDWKAEWSSILMKLAISGTTVVTIACIWWHYYITFQLFLVNKGMTDWRLGINATLTIQLVAETLFCLIHPLPIHFEVPTNFALNPKLTNDTTTTAKFIGKQRLAVDANLSVPMFLRVYLIGRVMLARSQLFSKGLSRTLGLLSDVRFGISFMFKALMITDPTRMLLVTMALIFSLGAWSVRACEMYVEPGSGGDLHVYSNSFYFVIVTYLTIGYGDIVTKTTCGRTVSLSCCILGLIVSALIVSVVFQMLELTHAEKYFYNFATQLEIQQQLNNTAARIVQRSWLAHRSRSKNKKDEYLEHLKKLQQAVQMMHSLRSDRNQMSEQSVTLEEMSRSQNMMITMVEKIRADQIKMKQEVGGINSTMDSVRSKLDQLEQNLA